MLTKKAKQIKQQQLQQKGDSRIKDYNQFHIAEILTKK